MHAEQQQQLEQRHGEGLKSILPEKGPSTSQILAILTLLPVGGFLVFLGVVTFMGTIIGLAVTTPLFVIFSPVLVPAAFVIGLAVMGFLASGVFGVTALSSLSWMARNFRSIRGAPLSQKMEQVKRRTQEAASLVGQKAKDTAQNVQSKAQEMTTGQEGGKTQESGKGQEGAKT